MSASRNAANQNKTYKFF